ncbi:CAP domain-containing protein [Streptomyces chiangmaiensis]|uniref:CAP domain-containing protein n=1 Tax=Streptomyces chiangmaiensis TaxID=766497 RepID=A0ABU7FHD8_9ACTN|nr:CAP domain-containing protein [Streptomyces chiangmaiensis]MED7823545.1 CAP domain-containing protein [Streptomyces chiangmaiensis]
MGKHRKKNRRRIVIAAVAMGAVGVPSVAVAYANWGDGGGHPSYTAAKLATKNRQHDADRYYGWNADGHGEPTSVASSTPTPSASAPKTTPPPKIARTTAPRPRTMAPRTTPSATASASTPATPQSTPEGTAPAPVTGAPASGAVARVVELVNAERAKVGCSPLTVNAKLTKAAQDHSEDMAAHQNMSHTGSDGSAAGDRITRAGYAWSTYGENVAYGYATPEQVMAGWMSSPGHKANILNCGFKEIGVGLAQPNDYWTQDFGAAR